MTDQSGTNRISFFGGDPCNGNLGVAALTEAVVQGLSSRLPGWEFGVYDHGSDNPLRVSKALFENGPARRLGGRWSRRLYSPSSLETTRLLAGARLPLTKPARWLLGSVAALDISGGDSFTDLYGLWRYRYVIMPKLVAIKAGVPLILMPQTYGPFEDEASARAAGEIIRDSRAAWARDERSLAVAKELLESVGAKSSDQLKLGVDVAFGLKPTEPAGSPDYRQGATTLAGLNVSGLLWNHPDKAVSQYGFKADYRELILGIARGVLETGDTRLLLIPHVLSDGLSSESDETACEEVHQILRGEGYADRVAVATEHAAASEAKWVVSRCDWFCGTRMHSTIAGLSSGVPTAAIAYSPKTLGVFETCGQGDHVADPRSLDSAAVVAHTLKSFENREQARQSLAENLPRVIDAASAQMDAIADLCRSLAKK